MPVIGALSGYGMSEAGLISTRYAAAAKSLGKVGSVGVMMPNSESKVAKPCSSLRVYKRLSV